MRESAEATTLRRKKLELLQKHYTSFNRFMADMMKELGFEATWMQHDIASYLQYGPKFLMVQAQRGEAKSTITAIFAVFSLIHNPKTRVVIVSAGEGTANEIATLVQRMIMNIDILECLRPDKRNGDRTSVEAFDVHYSLKGMDKSPSVACVGIGSNLPGKRADLVIADDIESPKNSMTAGARAVLSNLSREFSAWVTNDWARIVYLGTPQSTESVYNELPSRGFDVRIWPGRYPTAEELPNYGAFLAPALIQRMQENPALQSGGGVLADKGQPTDPQLFDEEKLQSKWRDWGESGFQLQYMLNTRLLDALRYPLKLAQAVILRAAGKLFPLVITRGFGPQSERQFTNGGFTFQMTQPHTVSEQTDIVQGTHMQIDPAGGGVNADESGYAVTSFLNGNVIVRLVGGMPGGYGMENLEAMADIAVRTLPNVISIEKNMGHGAYANVFLPVLRRKYKDAGIKEIPGIVEEFVTGQKEVRIIGTLEPVLGRGSLIFTEEAIEHDKDTCDRYGAGKSKEYSCFYQLSKMTKTRNCVKHDDRADALEGSVRHWVKQMGIDQQHRIEAAEKATQAKWQADPLQRKRFTSGPSRGGSSLFNRFRR